MESGEKLFRVSTPGPLLRLLHAFSRIGWYKFHTYKELADASGLGYSVVWRLCEALDKAGFFRVSYSLDSGHAKMVRPAHSRFVFTDGYVKYTVEIDLFGSLDVSVSFD